MAGVATRDTSRSLSAAGERPRRFGHLDARQIFGSGAPTLDERISSTWSVLVSEGAAECPVCAERLHAAGACPGCGSELS